MNPRFPHAAILKNQLIYFSRRPPLAESAIRQPIHQVVLQPLTAGYVEQQSPENPRDERLQDSTVANRAPETATRLPLPR